MPSNYYKAISEIKASDELKKKLKENINHESIKTEIKIGKSRKFIPAIISTITALLCGGMVFATLNSRAPVDEDRGIKFSEEYTEYEEIVENGPYLEKDGARIELVSTAVDEGFVILKFKVNLNEEQIREAKKLEGQGLYFITFNQKLIDNNGYKELYDYGNTRTIIIDGEEHWIRTGTHQIQEEVIKDSQYNVYQLWFLSDELKDKEEFTLTLKDAIICANDQYLEFDGKFEIQLSKKKIEENTTIINGNDSKILYKNIEQSIENLKITPLQNIVKLSTIEKNCKSEYVEEDAKEYSLGYRTYKVYDQDGKELEVFNTETGYKLTYEDGKQEKGIPGTGTGREDYKNAVYEVTEYLAIEQRKDITRLTIDVFEYNDIWDNEITTHIGTYTIDVNTKGIKSESENEIRNKSEEIIKETSYIEIQFEEYMGLRDPLKIYDLEVIEKLRKELNNSSEVNEPGVGVMGGPVMITFYYKDGTSFSIDGYSERESKSFLFATLTGKRKIYYTEGTYDIEQYVNDIYKTNSTKEENEIYFVGSTWFGVDESKESDMLIWR